MGSKVVEAVVQQIGRIHTNPNHRIEEPSRPIEQVLPLFKTAQPIEQIGPKFETKGGLSQKLTRPLMQVKRLEADDENSIPIEQVILVSEYEASPDGLFEQRRFVTADLHQAGPQTSKPVQQASLMKTAATRSKPVEQVANATNTIEIIQYDFLDLVFPPCNSIKNPVETNLLWRIRDYGFEFNTETLIFKVNGSPVQDRPEFSVTGLVNGLQLDYNPPEDFGHEEEVEVFLEIDDTAVPPNHFFVRCKWWTVPDTIAPIVINMQPACNSTGVDPWAPVEFDVVDAGDGVDPSSVRLTIEGVTVCSGVSMESVVVPGYGTGYHVIYEHPDDPFRFDASITVGVMARDLSEAANSVLFICFFDTAESEAPVFMNFVPEPCDSFVDNTTGLEFEVYGVEHGIDISTLEVRVDNKLRKVFVRSRVLRTQ